MSKQPLIDQLDQAISGILANPDFMPASADPALTELLGIAAGLRGLAEGRISKQVSKQNWKGRP